MKAHDTIPQHVSVLRREFETRASRNPGYSLRAFARDLDLSPAALSSLLNLKKGVSETRAQKIARRLALSRQESELFMLSAVSNHARAGNVREQAKDKLNHALKARARRATIPVHQLEQIQNWFHLALLELVDVEGCEHTPEWFSGKLGLNIRAVKSA
ncbi:MAG: helix-turn-helix domain-containing protein, partial [Bdellovibrionota bacterium]